MPDDRTQQPKDHDPGNSPTHHYHNSDSAVVASETAAEGATVAQTPSRVANPDDLAFVLSAETKQVEQSGLPEVDGFKVLGELGRGGMGVVYRAIQKHLHRPVALKMILAGQHASPESRLRFMAEAEVIAKLQHPGIVLVHEFGTHQGNPYFALEYLPGGSLADKLRHGLLPPVEAADLIRKLAEAVHAAHEAGIVHRDLKPANILLTEKGEPKVTDFGLAKRTGGSNLTATGAILGTPSYMAPEQATGNTDRAGSAADVYALGSILYECLTGRPPFRAASAVDTLQQVVTQEAVSVRTLQPKVPRDLETICHKCLQKEPGQRYRTGQLLADECARFLAGQPILTRPIGWWEKSWRWCKRNPAVAGLLAIIWVLLVGVAVASLWFTHRLAESNSDLESAKDVANERAKEARREVERFEVASGVACIERGDYFSGLLWFTAPLARDLPSAAEVSHRYRIHLYGEHTPHPTLLQQFGAGDFATLSPDGMKVLTIGWDRKARIWGVELGTPLYPPLDHQGQVLHASFDKSGKRVVTACKDGTARVWEVATGRPLTPPLEHQPEDEVRFARFSPDGRHVLTLSGNRPIELPPGQPIIPTALPTLVDPNGRFFYTARAWDAATGKELYPWLLDSSRDLKLEGKIDAWLTPDGCHVITADSQHLRVWDTISGHPLASVPESNRVGFVSYSAQAGLLMVVRERSVGVAGMSVVIWDLKKTPPESIAISPPEGLEFASLSANGRLIVVGGKGKSAYVLDTQTGKPVSPALPHGGEANFAAFSTDSRRVLTMSYDGMARLWDAKSGVAIMPPVPLGGEGNPYSAEFSPDGRRVLLVGNVVRLWDFATDQPLTHLLRHDGDAIHAAFSPNGKRVVTTSADHTAKVWDAKTGEQICPPLRHEEFVGYAAFCPESKRVATASGDSTVRVWEAESGRALSTPLIHPRPVRLAEFDHAGRNILTVSMDQKARVWDWTAGKENAAFPNCFEFAAMSPDGRQVIVAGSQLVGWDWATGKETFRPIKSTHFFHHVTFDATGRRFVAADERVEGRVWDAVTGEPLTPPLSHRSSVQRARFSQDGSRVVTASHDKTARVWEADTGRAICPPLVHLDSVIDAVFSPDGLHVLTASSDHTARIWETHSGQPVSPPLRHHKEVNVAQFSPDGDRILTASRDHTARVWTFLPDVRPVSDMVRLAQVLACRKLDKAGGILHLEAEQELLPWFLELKQKYPSEFAVNAQTARAWRTREIGLALKEGDLAAAQFHQNWLLAEAVLEPGKPIKLGTPVAN